MLNRVRQIAIAIRARRAAGEHHLRARRGAAELGSRRASVLWGNLAFGPSRKMRGINKENEVIKSSVRPGAAV